MKLTNMKMSDEEAAEYGEVSSLSDAPKYPYGLRIDLDDDALDKLGLGENLPRVGESFMVMCKVDVVSVSERGLQGGDSECSCGLQITDMAIEKPFESMNAESKLYGS